MPFGYSTLLAKVLSLVAWNLCKKFGVTFVSCIKCSAALSHMLARSRALSLTIMCFAGIQLCMLFGMWFQALCHCCLRTLSLEALWPVGWLFTCIVVRVFASRDLLTLFLCARGVNSSAVRG